MNRSTAELFTSQATEIVTTPQRSEKEGVGVGG